MPAHTATSDVIDEFTGDHAWLANASPHPIDFDGREWPSAEHAFAAAHTESASARDRIANAPTARAAAETGATALLRDDWPHYRIEAMRSIVAAKFTTHPQLTDALVDTGDALLINTGTDRMWGRVRQPGHKIATGRNELGQALMRTRAELRGDPPHRWFRAAVTGHRAHLIPDPATRLWAQHELLRLAHKLTAHHGTRVALSGMATGADLWWADAATRTGLPLWAYMPYPQQTQRWNADDAAEYDRLRQRAHRRVTVGGRAAKTLLHERNALMLCDADVVIAVRDPEITAGGTVAALRDIGRRRPIITVDVVARRTTIAAADPLYK